MSQNPRPPPSRFSSVFSRSSDQTSPNGAKSPSASRRSSFNFLRRGKTSDKSAEQPRQDSGQANAAARANANANAMRQAPLQQVRSPTREEIARQQEQQLRQQREQQLREQQAAAKSIPRLPSVQLLPRIKGPFGDDTTTTPPIAQPADSNHLISHSSSWTTIPKRPGGYNPAAFYNRDQQQMDNRSINTTNTQMSAVAPSEASTVRGPGKALSTDTFPRAASITNRSRYDYAAHPTNTTSAARTRRRRDPTPFK